MPEADVFFQSLLTLALSRNDRLYKFVIVDKPTSAESSNHTENSIGRLVLNAVIQRNTKCVPVP
jgi:hypothetical protein